MVVAACRRVWGLVVACRVLCEQAGEAACACV